MIVALNVQSLKAAVNISNLLRNRRLFFSIPFYCSVHFFHVVSCSQKYRMESRCSSLRLEVV